jgi:hypothetical protein
MLSTTSYLSIGNEILCVLNKQKKSFTNEDLSILKTLLGLISTFLSSEDHLN